MFWPILLLLIAATAYCGWRGSLGALFLALLLVVITSNLAAYLRTPSPYDGDLFGPQGQGVWFLTFLVYATAAVVAFALGFAGRLNYDPQIPDRERRTAISYAAGSGAMIGGVGGFIGGMSVIYFWLHQGPELAYLVTGPLGLVTGLLVGAIYGAIRHPFTPPPAPAQTAPPAR